MPIELGTARGYLELDLKNFDTAITSAQKGFDAIERKGKLAESEMKLISSQTEKTGTAFQQAAAKSKGLTNQLDTAKQKATLYKTSIEDLIRLFKNPRMTKKSLQAVLKKSGRNMKKAMKPPKPAPNI